MLSEMLETKKAKQRFYEVLFLHNNSSEDVEVHQVKHVDFLTIKERLEQGESVFITSKSAQKLVPLPKKRGPRSFKSKLVTAFQFEPVS